MRRSFRYLALAIAIGTAAGLHAQAPPAGDPRSAAAPQSGAGPDPATFAKQALQGGMTEVQLAEVAEAKSQDPQILSFAQRVVADHTTADQQLMGLAKTKGWAVPTAPDAQQAAMLEKLRAKSGGDFDAAFAEQMRGDHAKAIELFESAAHSSDADLAAWAARMVPTLKEHKSLADNLPKESRSSGRSKS